MTYIDIEIHVLVALMLTGLLLYVVLPVKDLKLWLAVFLFFLALTCALL